MPYCNAITQNNTYCRNKTDRMFCRKHKDYEKKKNIKDIQDYIDQVFKSIDKNIKSRFR